MLIGRVKIAVILVRLKWNLNFPYSFFEKFSNVKLHDNPFNGSPVIPRKDESSQSLLTVLRKRLKTSITAFGIPTKIRTRTL